MPLPLRVVWASWPAAHPVAPRRIRAVLAHPTRRENRRSTVDDQCLTRDPGRLLAGQEHGRARDVRGVPSRCRGTFAATTSSRPSQSALAISVFTRPGAMPLTRTAGLSSAASWRVRCSSAALVTL